MGAIKRQLLDISEKNDEFRKRAHRYDGHRIVTPGVKQLGIDFLSHAIAAVASFDQFDDENDPVGHHDFAVMTVDGIQIWWRIDYFCKDMVQRSPNPHDANITLRVLTIGLCSEY